MPLSFDDYKPCPTCRGKGKTALKNECPTCKGKGFMAPDDKEPEPVVATVSPLRPDAQPKPDGRCGHTNVNSSSASLKAPSTTSTDRAKPTTWPRNAPRHGAFT